MRISSRLYRVGLGLLALLTAVFAAACTAAPGTTTPTNTTTTTTTTTTPPPTGYTVNVSAGALGMYLVDGKGMTLYWTTRDAPGISNISGTVLANWPAFYSEAIVVPPSLSAGDFGSIIRIDGSRQTTYKDWPLYYYINDKAPGDTLGQGLADAWWVIKPSASMPEPTTTPPATTTTTTTPPVTTTTPLGVTVNLVAQNMAFNTGTITVPAGASVTVNFDNKDAVPHNFAVYTTGNASGTVSGPIFVGDVVTGPAQTTYTFTAPATPGSYFFRCDIHPSLMTGSFVVQ